MNVDIERLARGNSFLHRWDARWKLASFALYLLAAALLRHPYSALAAMLFSQLLLLGCGFPYRTIRHRLQAVHFVLIPCVLLMAFQWRLHPETGLSVAFHWNGFLYAVKLYLRIVAVITASMVLIYTTPIHRLLRAGESLGIPRVLVQITMMTYRYIFTLAQDLQSVRWALATRGVRNRFRMDHYRTLANVIGMILVRSLERTDRVYRAMQCRGYDGVIRSLEGFDSRWQDAAKSLVLVSVTAALLWGDWILKSME